MSVMMLLKYLFLLPNAQQLDVESQQFRTLQRLTGILHDKSSPSTSSNQKRRELLCWRMEKLLPTQNALLQQTGIWETSMQ